jgi:hypothetical protein
MNTPNSNHWRFGTSLLVLLIALAIVGNHLWDLLSVILRHTPDGRIYEPMWFLRRAAESLAAFFLAFAIHSVINGRVILRTVLKNCCAFISVVGTFAVSVRLFPLHWTSLFVAAGCFGILICLSSCEVSRLLGRNAIRINESGA